jgi:putative phosphoesterase
VISVPEGGKSEVGPVLRLVTVHRVLLIADTHVTAPRVDRLLERLAGPLAEADVVLHAGDVTDPVVLDALGTRVPVHAVRGNNDVALDRPERLTIDLDGVEVAMVHDSGPAKGRGGRLARWFPTADVVVFGHSHLPWHETHTVDGRVQHHVNPGSATLRRRAPSCSVAWLLVSDGAVHAIGHQPVG